MTPSSMRRHSDCVEYLVTNGADPLVADARRHNTCLHFAALYGHTDCVHKLLGSRATFQQQVGCMRQLHPPHASHLKAAGSTLPAMLPCAFTGAHNYCLAAAVSRRQCMRNAFCGPPQWLGPVSAAHCRVPGQRQHRCGRNTLVQRLLLAGRALHVL